MSRPPANAAVDALLRDLGPRLRRGEPPVEPLVRLPSGLPEVDRLLDGGFPRGRLSEIAGTLSSGRTSLALALLARTTRAGEACAVVDGADGFDPASAQAAGVVLERVLWVRARDLREALRGAERLLEAEGFGLVLLHLALARENPSTAPATWVRLARTAAGTGAALVLLTLERAAGTAAEVALEMRAAKARFSGTPLLLEELEVEVRLVRHRTAPADRSARVRLRTTQAE